MEDQLEALASLIRLGLQSLKSFASSLNLNLSLFVHLKAALPFDKTLANSS